MRNGKDMEDQPKVRGVRCVDEWRDEEDERTVVAPNTEQVAHTPWPRRIPRKR